jgi:hypothetical protein
MKIIKKLRQFINRDKIDIKEEEYPIPFPNIPDDIKWLAGISSILMDFRFKDSLIGRPRANDEESFF